ncbi:hypothetical protein MPSEU_001078200 [Mayamaea pseudoterrestris]|nr:hypothetical protein MPSEU_001078200 [Mayamaea pseudoterrestris]
MASIESQSQPSTAQSAAASSPSKKQSLATTPAQQQQQQYIYHDTLLYLPGFGNSFESEYIRGALPMGRNNPRNCQYYAEQLSGTAFTAPRHENKRTWLYRLQPSVSSLVNDNGASATTMKRGVFGKNHPRDCKVAVQPMRWKPMEENAASEDTDTSSSDSLQQKNHFIHSLTRVVAAGATSTGCGDGLSIYLYACNSNMVDESFYNADGDFLIVPQQGRLLVTTEVGKLQIGPTEVCVVPKGIVFGVVVEDDDATGEGATATAKGYVLEVCSSNGGFRLPELGPIGSNGLANARDFSHPVAWCVTDPDEYHKPHSILFKMDQELYARKSDHSPFNVAAWHGNFLPYKYNLQRFCAMNSVTYDHPDPSIYTVLTYPSTHAGTALADFVIFPPRYMAADANTFRPPWFHRNCMSEYMGLIYGAYDAKQAAGGFVPGGASLHNAMVPHGPDADAYDAAVADPCDAPVYFDKGLAFMFESCLMMRTSPQAEDLCDVDYESCWKGLQVRCDWNKLQEKKKDYEKLNDT